MSAAGIWRRCRRLGAAAFRDFRRVGSLPTARCVVGFCETSVAPVTYEDDVGVSDRPWRWVGDSRLQATMAKQVNIGMVSPRVDFAMLTGVMTSKSCYNAGE